ncbi:MAG TPA: adenylate/guanylate cyclase domain-containing protein [Spirochaetota bacterium]|nr:adenylate/guanylate cyclase domain-containing protein [Spirochaetota bacterium]
MPYNSSDICAETCPYYNFAKNSREAVYITSRDGAFIMVNGSMEKLLGYEPGGLMKAGVKATLDSDKDRGIFQETIEREGSVHNYQMTMRRKDGTPLFCLVDAVVWKEDGAVIGYHGIVKTRDDIVDAFQRYFLKLKEEKSLIRKERRSLVSDSRLVMTYISEDLIEYIQQTGENPFVNRRRVATVLFFDIRGSSAIAESLESERFASILSDILTDVMDLVYGNHGSVNKLLGDGLMATFGCPITHGDDAYNAVQAAVRIREYLSTFNDVRPDYLRDPVRAGIGIATGSVFSGVIGSVRRQEYTVLGDPVNVASRLESSTKSLGEEILVDQKTYDRTKDKFQWRIIPDLALRGRKETVNAYAV